MALKGTFFRHFLGTFFGALFGALCFGTLLYVLGNFCNGSDKNISDAGITVKKTIHILEIFLVIW